MIEIKNATKSYDRTVAVHNVSLTVPKHSITGLVGLNGAGKTTLLKAIAGIHYIDSGSITVNGIDVHNDPFIYKSHIGCLLDYDVFLPDFTVYECLHFEAKILLDTKQKRDLFDRINKVIDMCSLKEVIDKLVKTLSKGYKQRLALAKAMLHNPPILLLDEPTSGLDPRQIMELRSLIKKLSVNTTILISTHIMQEIEALCSSIAIIHEGELIEFGSESDICKRSHTTSIEKAFLSLISKRNVKGYNHEV